MEVIVIGGPKGLHPALHRTDRTLEDVVDAVTSRSTGDVVLATRDDAARKVARAARHVLGPERIGVLHVEAHVTAWAAALSGLAGTDVPAPAARAVVDDVLGRTSTRGLVSSVTSLNHPTPTFRQHAGSYLPRTAFVVAPDRGTVGRYLGRLGIPDGDLLVVARSTRPVVPDADTDVLPRAADTELEDADADWKATRWLEASVVAGPVEDAGRRVAVRAARWRSCDTCGRVSSGTCLFCDISEQRPPGTSPGPSSPVSSSPYRTDHLEVIS